VNGSPGRFWPARKGRSALRGAGLVAVASSARWSLERQARLADGEVVVPRKHQVKRLAVAAHPLRRETGRLAGADVPFLGEVRRRPRPPRLGRVVDAEAALEPGVGLFALGPRDDLHPQIAPQPGVERDPTAEAPAPVREDRTAVGDLPRPQRPALLV